MFDCEAMASIDYESLLQSFDKKIQSGWQFYCDRQYDNAIASFKAVFTELFDLKMQIITLKIAAIVDKINQYEQRLKLAIYFSLCHKEDQGTAATAYANEQQLFPPGPVQFDEILISNQAIVAKHIDSSVLIQPKQKASFERACMAGRIDEVQIVCEQIFRDGNHRTAIWHTYLLELKAGYVQRAACEPYKLYAVLVCERYLNGAPRDNRAALCRRLRGYNEERYQQHLNMPRNQIADGNHAASLRYSRFLEVRALDDFLWRLIGNSLQGKQNAFRTIYESFRQLGAEQQAARCLQEIARVEQVAGEDRAITYARWRERYDNFMALGGGAVDMELHG